MSAMTIDRSTTMAEAVDTMRAIVAARYGRPEAVLELRDVARPAIEADQALVRVHASSVNPTEWYQVTGPLFARMGAWRRPAATPVGADVAGVVEAVGAGVTALRPGDEVFGTASGAWAEYAAAREIRVAAKPSSVSFAETAAVPIAATTALQALRDHGQLQKGQRVLVNGASGGVGTFAVQLAKSFGADVTAVCSTANVDLAWSLGADRVVDYTREDFTRSGERHDLLLDIAGSRSLGELGRVLTPQATVVLVGGRMTFRGLGPLPHLGATLATSKLRRRTVRFFVAKINTDDLAFLASLLEAGTIRSVIDRTYELERTPGALAYLGEGHARGKIVVTI